MREYDLAQHTTSVITSTKMPEAAGFVDIQGDQVVWSKGSTAGGTKQADVYMYDLASQRMAQLSHDGQSGQPTIGGDLVPWRQGFGDMGPIVFYNWKTGEETVLSESGEFPRLGDGLACWEHYSGGVRSVLYDLNRNIADGFIRFWRAGEPLAYDVWPSLWKRKVALVYRDTQSEKSYLEVRQYD